MLDVCFYFEVHQPHRIRPYGVFDLGKSHDYFDRAKNREILRRVAAKCYRPMNELLLELVRRHDGRFRCAFSLTGTLIEQLAEDAPDVLELFRELADTGCVEFLAETCFHSLSAVFDRDEFDRQVAMHRRLVEQQLGQTPRVFRNTELIMNNDLARHLEARGFAGAVAEGADRVLGWRSPNFLYTAAGAPALPLLLKNYRLSDDIAFRFGNQQWESWPLDADKFAGWVDAIHGNGETLNLFMDYETFGEHQWEHTGIFEFMRALPGRLLQHPDLRFATPSQVIERLRPVGEVDMPEFVSWADMERDLTAWLGNDMQRAAAEALHGLLRAARRQGAADAVRDLERLSTSDHFYYMCTKWFADGDVHKYFNPHESPYEAYIAYMTALNDLAARLDPAQSDAPALRLSEAPHLSAAA